MVNGAEVPNVPGKDKIALFICISSLVFTAIIKTEEVVRDSIVQVRRVKLREV